MLPGIFEPTIFTPELEPLKGPRFIRAMHPKAEIEPTRAAVTRVIAAGWWGQLKIHGHRAQVHVPADQSERLFVFNRQGRPHRMELPPALVAELRRLFTPPSGWTVIDAEWLKPEERIFVFDILRRADVNLDDYTYAERFELLPRVYSSPHIETLPTLRTVDHCMAALADTKPYIEGLVFRAPASRGFADTAIIRCRR